MANAKMCDLCGELYCLKRTVKDVPANNIMYLQKDSIKENTDRTKIEMCDNCAMIIDEIMNNLKQNKRR